MKSDQPQNRFVKNILKKTQRGGGLTPGPLKIKKTVSFEEPIGTGTRGKGSPEDFPDPYSNESNDFIGSNFTPIGSSSGRSHITPSPKELEQLQMAMPG